MIKITRTKIYPTPGTNSRFAWKYLYTATNPDGTDIVKHTTLGDATRRAKKAAKELGCEIKTDW